MYYVVLQRKSEQAGRGETIVDTGDWRWGSCSLNPTGKGARVLP